ncbi:glyoxalase superfamily protein [Paenibacillus thermotolerans]|uniref:glyoxalase superfamily protein n=1 Tax=Paenibacillus thermotolerans TaxID=3027807 RepID=UPI0023679213|nr:MULTISPECIES: glyoxalase superfamily protein [unclassified Paenibacillus]
MGENDIRIQSVTPILRIFDEEKAREFYLGFLEFQLDWEHRFEADFPLYMQVSRGDCILHLSEHHGDSTPGSAIRIEVKGIKELHANLLGKQYKFARPGLEKPPWGGLEVTVGDPFGNRIVFFERD